MITVATNIFGELTPEEKSQLVTAFRSVDSAEVFEYIEKGLNIEQLAKFIFSGVNLLDLVRDGLMWDLLKKAFARLASLVQEKYGNSREVQIWIQDDHHPVTINVAFALKKKEDISKQIDSLKEVLKTRVLTRNLESKGPIFWLAYDGETNSWQVKEFQ